MFTKDDILAKEETRRFAIIRAIQGWRVRRWFKKRVGKAECIVIQSRIHEDDIYGCESSIERFVDYCLDSYGLSEWSPAHSPASFGFSQGDVIAELLKRVADNT